MENDMITIHRKGYTRSAYTTKNGKTVPKKYISPVTYQIENKGNPGVTSRGAEQGPYKNNKPWITHEGKLGGKGYLSKTAEERHKILDKCVKGWGYKSCLGSIMVLNRSSEIKEKYGNKLNSDKKYLENKYGKNSNSN